MNDKPKRRWYQFSLRTMLIAMIVASAGFGYWVHWSKEWIRQRHQMMDAGFVEWYVIDNENVPRAPGGLWVFGEKGVSAFYVSNEEGVRVVRRLYPEATIKLGHGHE